MKKRKRTAKDLKEYVNAYQSEMEKPVFTYYASLHSWGGYAATAILKYKYNIAGSVSLSGFNAPKVLAYVIADYAKSTKKKSIGILAKIAYLFISLFHIILFGKMAFVSGMNGINKSNIPVMIIHGEKDEVVSFNGPSILAKKAYS